jgi:hypothetical protein
VRLPRQDLAQVLGSLSPADGGRVLTAVTGPAPAGEPAAIIRQVCAAWLQGCPAEQQEWAAALRLCLAVARDQPQQIGATLRAAALALARLARLWATADQGRRAMLLEALAAGDPADLHLAAQPADAEVISPLLGCPPDVAAGLAATLLGYPPGPAGQPAAAPQAAPAEALSPGPPAAAAGPCATRFGGALLLLPLLAELPLERVCRSWPDAGQAPAAAALRLLILAKCCGPARAGGLLADPALARLAGVGQPVPPATLAGWAGQVTRSQADGLLSELAAGHARRAPASRGALALISVSRARGPLALLVDLERGHWLLAVGYHPRRTGRLLERLRLLLAPVGPFSDLLVGDVQLAGPVAQAFPKAAVTGADEELARRLDTRYPGAAAVLNRPHLAAVDLAHLELPQPLPGPIDLAATVAAQGVLRGFAWRLPGFAASSLPYLYANFLDVPGSVEEEPTRRVARMARPPLGLVIGLTGLAGGSHRLDWLDDRPLMLFQER